ncbi:MAG: hypothetical protein WC860_08080, partial [Candidatus Margulisiibacteriota bacterium]
MENNSCPLCNLPLDRTVNTEWQYQENTTSTGSIDPKKMTRNIKCTRCGDFLISYDFFGVSTNLKSLLSGYTFETTYKNKRKGTKYISKLFPNDKLSDTNQ